MKLTNNRRPATIIFSLLALILTAVPLAYAQATGTSIASQAAQVTEFQVNGLKVLVKRRPNSQTVATGLFIRGGTRMLTANESGIESFTLDAACEGSVKYPRAVMRRELAATGSSIGSSSNYDFSVVSLASTRDSFDRSWDIFTDVVMNPAFAKEDVELTRSKTLTAMQGRDDEPDSFLQSQVDKTILSGTSYGQDAGGTMETVGRFTEADLRAYQRKMMVTSRLLLIVVGDIDAEKIKQLVTKSLAKLPVGSYKEPALPKLDFSKPTLDISKRPLPTNYINGIFAAPSLSDPDYAAMRVVISMLSDRVFEEVRVKRNLSYAPNADMGSLAANTGAIYVTAVDANQAVSVMLNEINKLKTVPVTADDISGVSGQFLTQYFLGEETNAAQAGELARYELVGGGWRNAFEYINRVKQVKPIDVQNAAKKYIKNLRFVVVGDPAAIDRSIFLAN